MQIDFPMPLGTALQWASQQTTILREEGYGDAVLEAVRPMFSHYAQTGDHRHLVLAQRILQGER